MADQFIGEIRMVGFNFAPYQWALCNGQLLSISQNTALFSLLGTQFGGDGRTTFGLPNLQGVAPMHQGDGAGLTPRVMGETGGESAVTLLQTQLPPHRHLPQAAGSSDAKAPGPSTIFGDGGRGKGDAYAPVTGNTPATMNPQAVGITGGSHPHNNLPPYLVANFVIALVGIFPTRG
jgi:microcystin-dependent protein